MDFTECISEIFVSITFCWVKPVTNYLVLDPLITKFIDIAFIIGPLLVLAMFVVLKQIEKTYPERIRWK